jgi:predicted CoA-substrate-specific enzyme activase
MIKMICAGIDVGAQNTKMVILDNDQLLASRILNGICDARKELRIAFEELLIDKTIGFDDLSGIGATGLGRELVDFATASIIESKCSARGAIRAFPGTRTLVDIGAEQCQALSCDEQGRVIQYVRNESCAAGAGLFLEEMAALLGVGVAEIGALAGLAKREINISNTCVIFAESEVISLVSDGYSREEIARAVCEAIALRTLALLRNLEIKDEILLIGGVALNTSVQDILQKKLGRRLVKPVDPLMITAAGAACIARELKAVG